MRCWTISSVSNSSTSSMVRRMLRLLSSKISMLSGSMTEYFAPSPKKGSRTLPRSTAGEYCSRMTVENQPFVLRQVTTGVQLWRNGQLGRLR